MSFSAVETSKTATRLPVSFFTISDLKHRQQCSEETGRRDVFSNAMSHAYTEDQLVEQPAIGLFAELGWQTASAMEEVFGCSGTLGP